MKLFLARVAAMVIVASALGIGAPAQTDPWAARLSVPTVGGDFSEPELSSESFTAHARTFLDEEGRIVSESRRIQALDTAAQALRDKDPAALGEWSQRLLREISDSDERITVARNLMWAGGAYVLQAREEVRKRIREAGDSTEFAVVQAMDGIVYFKDTDMLPGVVDLLQDPEFEVLAAQTIDRLADAAPLATMEVLNSRPSLLNDRPMLRADCFAKADISDGKQRAAFEHYLLRKDVPRRAKEKAIFALAQRGRILSVGLFTGACEPATGDVAGTDIAPVLAEWIERRDFAEFRSALRECLGWVSETPLQ